MKVISKILSFILSMVLFMLILMFSLNLVIKGVIQKQIIGGVAKDQILNEYISNNEFENKEEIKKILEEPEALSLANSVIDEYLKYVSDNNHKINKKTVTNIINFFIKNREKLNEISHSTVTEEELRSQETFDNIEKGLNEGFAEVNVDIGATASQIIKIYSKLISNNFQILLIISSIISVILLMIFQNSLYRWMSTFGFSLLMVGTLICGFFTGLNSFVPTIQKHLKLEIEIKLNDMLVIGIIEIILGIILLVTKTIISKMKTKNHKTSVETTNKNEQPVITTNKEQEDDINIQSSVSIENVESKSENKSLE